MPPRGQFDFSAVRPYTAPAAATPAEDEGWSGIDTTAALIRGGSGLLGASGGWPGAAAAAIGEALAEGVEFAGGKGPKSFTEAGKRIGTEAGLGLIPGGRAVKPFKFIRNFLKSGLLSGGGDIARQVAAQEDFDPSKIDLGRAATAAAIGGGSAAAVQKGIDKFLPGFAATQRAADEAREAARKARKAGGAYSSAGSGAEEFVVEGNQAYSKGATVPDVKLSGKGKVKGVGRVPAEAPKTIYGQPRPAAPPAGRANPNRVRTGNLADAFERLLAGEEVAPELATSLPRGGRVPYGVPTAPTRSQAAEQAEVDKLTDLFNVAVDKKEQRLSEEAAKAAEKARETARKAAAKARETAIKEAGRVAREAERKVEIENLAKARADERMGKLQGEALDENIAFDKIRAAKAGLDEQPPTVTETARAPMPGGTQTATTRFTPPDPEDAGGSGGDAASRAARLFDDILSDADAPRVPTTGPVRPIEPAARPETTALRKFLTFEDPLSGADLWYRTLKDEERAGGTFPKAIQSMIGRALGRAKANAGVAPGARIPNPVEGPTLPPIKAPVDPVPTPPAAAVAGAADDAPLDVNSPFYDAAAVAEAAKAGRPVGSAADAEQVSLLQRFLAGVENLPKISGEAGRYNPELMTALATGLGGGLTGAAWGAAEGYNPLLAGLAGAGVGFAAPYAAAKGLAGGLPSLPDFSGIGGQLKDAFGSPQATSNTIASTLEQIPRLQRSNLLFSPSTLIANGMVAPYGSTMMAGLELALSGDPRGMDILKAGWNPASFVKRFAKSVPKAEELVAMGEEGRMEDLAPGAINTAAKLYQAFPGIFMTAGDQAAEEVLTGAGLPLELAKRFTLVSEPQSTYGRGLQNLRRGAPKNDLDRAIKALAGLEIPFTRTPTNVFEQGLIRIPVGGQIGKMMLDPANVDLRELGAQGLLGAATSGAGYLAGSNLDPESARSLKKFITNAPGVYSLPTSIGYTLGQANNRLSQKQTIGQVADTILPLPTAQPFEDIGGMLAPLFGGEFQYPRGALPAFVNNEIREANERLGPQAIPRIPSISEMRQSRRRGGS